MIVGRIAQPIATRADQHQELLVMTRSLKIEKRYSLRAKVILLSLENKPLEAIIEETGLSRPVVNKWRQRFRLEGIAGLKDTARSVKPTKITASNIIEIILCI